MNADRKLEAWVNDIAALCQPDRVVWCYGTTREHQALLRHLVQAGSAVWLDEGRRPGSVLVRSDPADVARVEEFTFICSASADDAGPTNNWRDPDETRRTLSRLFTGSMSGRTMFVIPYCLGPLGSPFARVGVQITDSAYAAANMQIMARVGAGPLEGLEDDGEFVRGLHSVGAPLAEGAPDAPWPCNAQSKYICHFPEAREIWSYGSGYGGNALLGKKCHALRIASVQARDEGWLAEHMLILGLTSPAGRKLYLAAAFPSSCGKTNLAMMTSALPGWKVETIGDDIAWLRVGSDGRLWAVNPEAGFFGVAPGTSARSNPNAMLTVRRDAIFTNCALTPEGDVWWEELTSAPPPELMDWLRRPWTPRSGRRAAHPNARFTVSARNCPVLAPEWEDPRGVPIAAILFGGRRAGIVPLVCEARSWRHGVFLGSIMSSETTSAAAGNVGILRHDPFAMLPFCGYHMGDYFAHWLAVGERAGVDAEPGAAFAGDAGRTGDEAEAAGEAGFGRLPRIYFVNWFRRGAGGRFLWPGYGENARVLKWIFERVAGEGRAVETAIGRVPAPEALDLAGLEMPEADVEELLRVDIEGWMAELPTMRAHYEKFGPRLPAGLREELHALEKRLRAVGGWGPPRW